jgi:hypothetical protein
MSLAMMVAPRDRAFRSLKGLERTGATSRVLNLAAIVARHAERCGERPPPLFSSGVLGGALIIKHRLRPDELSLFRRHRRTATKLVIPIERTDLSLGGRSLFVGQTGWTRMLGALHGERNGDAHDVALLEALDELPSLDPFLVREQLKRRRFETAAAYFVLSPADLDRMYEFVRQELMGLVRLACGADRVEPESDRLVHAILSGEQDLRLESLRAALHLDEANYGEGLFCWRGLLYYKWVLEDVLPTLATMTGELGEIRLTGARPPAVIDEVYALKSRVAAGLSRRTAQIAEALGEYDVAFGLLRDQVDPSAFARFLMGAPAVFRTLGEDMGALSHVASYWRYRFPADAPLLAPADELTDILEDYAHLLD